MTTQQEENLINLLDGYCEKGGHHLNVNVFNRETLIDAQAHPERLGRVDYGETDCHRSKRTGGRLDLHVLRHILVFGCRR